MAGLTLANFFLFWIPKMPETISFHCIILNGQLFTTFHNFRQGNNH